MDVNASSALYQTKAGAPTAAILPQAAELENGLEALHHRLEELRDRLRGVELMPQPTKEANPKGLSNLLDTTLRHLAGCHRMMDDLAVMF